MDADGKTVCGMPEYIEREAFLADKKWLYCTDCDKRKGKKRGKMVTLYEIGEAPCKSCGIHDMLEEVELYPAADAIEKLQKDLKRSKDFEAFWQHEAEEALKKFQVAISNKPRWIPVTERLPEERGNYLAVINCPRGRWDEICAFDGEKEWVSIDEYAEIATKWVTHWMPLPEPPNEE